MSMLEAIAELQAKASTSVLLVKRLRQSEIGWFHAARDRETGRQRGLNIDAGVVGPVFRPGDATTVELETRHHDGASVVDMVRPLKKQKKNWRLTGSAVRGSRFQTASADDIVILLVTCDGRHLTWDWVSQNQPNTRGIWESAQRLLGARSLSIVGGEHERRLMAMARRRLPSFGGDPDTDTGGLSDVDWDETATWMADRLNPLQLLELINSEADAPTTEVLKLLGASNSSKTPGELAKTVLQLFGPALLENRARRALLASVSGQRSPTIWRTEGEGAKRFARELGLPEALAGTRVLRAPVTEDVDAWPPLGDLHSYQDDVATGIAQVLAAGTWQERRGVVWLPTGTGKTRVTVETLIRECDLRPPRSCLVWVADRAELCEQAVEAFRHVWMVRGHTGRTALAGELPTLRVVRAWGGRKWAVPSAMPGLVVATIQTLSRLTQSEDGREQLALLGERTAAVVFDEAHHVVAPSYRRVLVALGLAKNRNVFGRNRQTAPPVLGLTATPSRSSDDETAQLSRSFSGRLIEPQAPFRSLSGYQKGGFLSTLQIEKVSTGWTIELSGQEEREVQAWNRLPESVLNRAAAAPERTARILSDLLERLSTLRSVLVFSCTVQHARSIAEVLRRKGVTAGALDGSSPRATRWRTIQKFRRGDLQVLVNCDLLATGFDAPCIDAIVLARPVTSRILLTQMVGRGLRGPRNGGTKNCLLLDYADSMKGATLEQLRLDFRTAFLPT